jgi:hypothetical protein
MTEQTTPPATEPKPDDDAASWDRLGKMIDDKVTGALNTFFPPEEPPNGASSGSGGGAGESTPPKRGGGASTTPAKTEAQPPSEGGAGHDPAARKRGFLGFLYR